MDIQGGDHLSNAFEPEKESLSLEGELLGPLQVQSAIEEGRLKIDHNPKMKLYKDPFPVNAVDLGEKKVLI
ncbi:hypothetical protein GUJ93_ZPchr0002g25121 [Zizania palustris]|uniref:Uncharacterized protein n=1 Tax=Zizania palustris TaxID=103762 RepID=A0A8J5RYR1_ZIZPA|nr:hypothetical protein GUJ93_ZPchr0002g25121 [Zizania palustris]